MRFNPNDSVSELFNLNSVYTDERFSRIARTVNARNYDTLPSLVDNTLDELVLRVEAQPRLDGDLVASRNSGEPVAIFNRRKMNYSQDVYYDVAYTVMYDYRPVTGQEKHDTLRNSVYAIGGSGSRILMTYELAQTECILLDGLFYLQYTMQNLNSTLWSELYPGLQNFYGKLPRAFIMSLTTDIHNVMEIESGHRLWQWFDEGHNDIGFCRHYEEWYHRDLLIWHEGAECYYHEDAYDEYNDNDDNDDNDPRTYQLNGYHCGLRCESIVPNPDTLRTDVPALKQFTIGFEIEKTAIYTEDAHEITRGDSIEIQPLFNHWELDSSCGVEGVTHVYNLADYDTFAAHVNVSDYVDAPHHISCGGHTNIAYDANSITDFHMSLRTIQPFIGVLYSMFKKRLRNSYAYNNKKLNERSQSYSPVTIKQRPERAEFRLPSGIKNKAQLLRRFKLFAHLVTHIHTYDTNKDYYLERMDVSNSRNKVEYGKNKLYKDFAYDVCFNHKFYKSELYQRTLFLLSDIGYLLEASYKGRLEQLKTMLINTYQFQAWLDDSANVNLTSIVQYIQKRNSEASNPLTPAQRHWQPTFTPEECRNDFINNPDEAIQDNHYNTTENVSL